MDKDNSGVFENCNNHIREKLEILRHKLAGMISAAVEPCDEGECCESCKYFHSTACTDYLIADFLIANGVTVLPVQVGDTVYGRFRSYGKKVHKCEVVKSRIDQFKDGTLRCFLDLEFYIIDPFFRDRRLMRCGMQAVFGENYGSWDRVYLTREEAEVQPPKGE